MQSEQAVRTQLQARLDVLLKRVGDIAGDLRRPGDRDWQERAVELENDEVLENLDDSTRAEVAQVRAALRRLDAGSYGRCSKCGEPIGPVRLAAIPSTATCVGCAEK